MSLDALRQKKVAFHRQLNLPQEKLRIAKDNVKLRDPQVIQDGLRLLHFRTEKEQEIQKSNGEVNRLFEAHKDQLSTLMPRSSAHRAQPNLEVLERDTRHGKMIRDELMFRATDDEAVKKHLETIVNGQNMELMHQANTDEQEKSYITAQESSKTPHQNPYQNKHTAGTTVYNKERRKALKVSYTAL